MYETCMNLMWIWTPPVNIEWTVETLIVLKENIIWINDEYFCKNILWKKYFEYNVNNLYGNIVWKLYLFFWRIMHESCMNFGWSLNDIAGMKLWGLSLNDIVGMILKQISCDFFWKFYGKYLWKMKLIWIQTQIQTLIKTKNKFFDFFYEITS